MKLSQTSLTLKLTLGLTLALGGITANWSCSGTVDVGKDVTPPEARFGLAENYQELSAPIVAAAKPLLIVGADGQDNARKNVRLWEARLKVSGSHFANTPQQIGDCVSWGAKNAIRYRLAVQTALGRSREGGDPFSPFLYGVARVTYGHGNPPCRSDGAVGAYAAEGFRDYGWITDDESGVAYSGKIARDWGCKGPPRELLAKGAARKGGDIAPAKSVEEMRDALCNGYPVTIASEFGTKTIRPQDGRQVASRNDRWPHQMCLIGYDGSVGDGREYFYVINSWGANAHPQPLQNEPPGGFWITWKDAEWIARTGDCWAFSDVPGFQAQEIDWSVFDQFVVNRAQAPDERIVHRGPVKTNLAP